MTVYKWTNNPRGTLLNGIGTGDPVSMTLQSGEGAEFPTLTSGYIFDVYVSEGSDSEWMVCTARSSDVLTCTRGAVPIAFSADAVVELKMSSDALDSFQQKSDYREVTSDPNGTSPEYTYEEVYDNVNAIFYKHTTGTTWVALNS
jgi:hypothetical protein